MLYDFFRASARRLPSKPAVIDPQRNVEITYSNLETQSEEVRDALQAAGVRAGDRVGICSPKSNPSLAALLGTLKAGAAYVPVDPYAPAARNAFIFSDCTVRAVIVENSRLPELQDQEDGLKLRIIRKLDGLDQYGVDLTVAENTAAPKSWDARVDYDLAYILYTSGSTGKPKGVVHSHASAESFVNWCSETFDPVEEDRFSSHAPFHFDLSILDIYVPLKHGCTIVLFGESIGKEPVSLGKAIAEHDVSFWYSTPSILRLLVESGVLEKHDYSSLRVVNFAGEVFPLKHLRALIELWPHPRYFNLYGPTETNVCTFFEATSDVRLTDLDALPIGKVCSNDRARIVNQDDKDVDRGDEGELFVTGGSVMVGYWNAPDKNAEVFVVDDNGERWYRTGDVVREAEGGDLMFLGRRDRMVKRRGYRVELGEIEAALYKHPSIAEAGVVAIPNEQSGVVITAYLSWADDGHTSQIRMKRFCADNLPLYMVPDRFAFLPALPKTSTGKIDYQGLAAQLA